MPEKPPAPHPNNVPGDFYVEDNCCTTCSVVFDEAPGHFEYTETESSCFVKKQPTNKTEISQMINAVWVSEVSCVRYRGTDPLVLSELVKKGERRQCDVLVFKNSEEVDIGLLAVSIRLFGKLQQLILKK